MDHIAQTNRLVVTTVLEGRVEVDVTAVARFVDRRLSLVTDGVPLASDGRVFFSAQRSSTWTNASMSIRK